MAPNIRIGRAAGWSADGFTLVELMIVVSIVGILATIAAPSYQSSLIKARETVLRQDLFTLRDLLDHHRADQGKYPLSLEGLVATGYLRALPKDPFTNSSRSWQEISDPTEGGIFDVYSGSDLIGTNGLPYNKW
ncbi:MAG: general secretion pathway protein GspG [Nitrospira sp. HN-bin3]|uniref:prepilin-type N-terminal cleavage/methylation domain-containing protein n=1 Tax=Nitrospira cf. moscoviensis SBR1015 TaxID=96242 RepID=UPI000A0D8291|nr:prepilin-type N-terminal cleavage/methylation domain-containing protein [Nitrospira cf. moscoviensis SBR1015]MBH0208184.1 prepilin-type N-terminal cleavage/methylation domain-containing protein [Nitrospira sp.]OQW43726.1 MAG: general secretion pathway protein GspG [Nitrospira sp. HN-bin3]